MFDISRTHTHNPPQGYEFDRAIVSLKGVKGHGRVYTILSRVRSLSGLQLADAFNPDAVTAYGAGLKFVAHVEARADEVGELVRRKVAEADRRQRQREEDELMELLEEKRMLDEQEAILRRQEARQRGLREDVPEAQQAQDRSTGQEQPRKNVLEQQQQPLPAMQPLLPLQIGQDQREQLQHSQVNNDRKNAGAANCKCGRPEKKAPDGKHVCRYFGKFVCLECGRWWDSACAYAPPDPDTQQCKGCGKYSSPQSLRRLAKKPPQSYASGQYRGHQRGECSMCQKKGSKSPCYYARKP